MSLRLAGLAFPLFAGCALPQSPIAAPDGTLYQGTTDSLQYRSPVPRDVPYAGRPLREALGKGCRTMITFPISPPTVFLGSDVAVQAIPWTALGITVGNDGYAKAVARARASVGGAPLFDVRVDLHTTAVLSIVRLECVEVHALAVEPVAAPPVTAPCLSQRPD